ncbi:putative protein CWC15-like protein [Iris pallida]|uniref:Uncharacterized protein n=1 Tax=Iris pallida TaxID=29817 RepID=A0AAX6IDY5_IRIPA|nr:putative protein CWC15-like protein [Iris pallida]
MTTAARPTWAPAKGGQEQGGTRIFGPSQKYSSRDLASHTTLKPRRKGQDTLEELQEKNFREELGEREKRHFSSKDKPYAGAKREAEDRIIPRNVDADDSDVDVQSSDESYYGSDDEDDTAALLAELERIKKERAEEKLRKDRQKQEEDLKNKEAELMRGNPLINMNNSTSFSVTQKKME